MTDYSIDSWRECAESSKAEGILIRFSSTVNTFDSKLNCTYDVPPPPSFTWEEVGRILVNIYRHSSELLGSVQSKEDPDQWVGDTGFIDNPAWTPVTFFSTDKPSSCSPSPHDEENDSCSIYSEPPIQRSLVPPIKVSLTEKKDEQKRNSIFEVSLEDFFRVLNSRGRLDLHFCFCWATRKTLSMKPTEDANVTWSHEDFTSLAESLRGSKEEAIVSIEKLFEATENLCLFLEKYRFQHNREEANEIERGLLCVIGSAHADVRRRALAHLEMFYNGHTMEFKATERYAFNSVGDKVDIFLDDSSENGDPLSTRIESSLYVQVFCCGSVLWRRFWGYSRQRGDDCKKLKLTLLHAAELPGFYDWRLIDYDAEKGEVKEVLKKGRVVVFPALKEATKTDQGCSFLEARLSGDRGSLSSTTIPPEGEKGDLCVMNFPLSVSALSWNRRFKNFLSIHCEPGSGSSVPTYSVAQSPETGLAVLNYRLPETVDSVLKDMRLWLDKKEASSERVAVVLQGDWPYLCAPATSEMERMDDDGSFHYQSAEASLESPLVNQEETIPVESDSGANLILSKIARGIWGMCPRAILYIETTSVAQHVKALCSGFVPVDKTMESILTQGVYEKVRAHIPAQGSAAPIVRIPPDMTEISPFARVLIQFGIVSVLGRALNPSHYLFETEENDKRSSAEARIYPVEWYDLNGTQERRITSFAAKQRDRIVVIAFLPDGSKGTTAEPAFSEELTKLVPDVLCVSGVARRGSLSLVPPQHMTRKEFLHEHHFTDFTPGSDGIQVWTIRSSSCSEGTLYESSIYRLAGLIDRKISHTGNMVYDLLREAASASGHDPEKTSLLLEKINANVPRFARRALGRVLSHLFYVGHDLPLGFLGTLRSNCAEVLRGNELGAIVFVSAEMGRFSTVGGVGVLVDELTRSIARQGYKVFVVTPYFNYNKYGHTDYLRAEDGFSYRGNITVGIGDWEQQSFGVHVGKENGVDLVFLHNYTYFPTPYSGETADYKLRSVVALSKAALQACVFLNIKPSIVVSNDWPTALVAPYGNGICYRDDFDGHFKKTKFFHIIHNVEKGYDGELFFDDVQDTQSIHNVPREIIQYGDNSINLTMASLKSVDNWGTVSKSYQHDLIERSKFSEVMRRCPDSFAFSNGIRSEDRLSALRKISPTLSHEDAKKALQEKYFNRSDPSIPVFGFVGRICEQKGVELLAYVAQDIISRTGGKVQFIIGGYAPANDPYAKRCASLLNRLHAGHPSSLWADPDRFFLDGGLVNLGADFAVMPSLFEPGGIVQHEFFVAGTPVIAFKTGGLKDTVIEYDRGSGEGNGFTFEGYYHDDLCRAVARALDLYNADPSGYQKLRENARRSALDMEVVASAWANEFCRLCGALPPPLSRPLEEERTKERIKL